MRFYGGNDGWHVWFGVLIFTVGGFGRWGLHWSCWGGWFGHWGVGGCFGSLGCLMGAEFKSIIKGFVIAENQVICKCTIRACRIAAIATFTV